LNNVLAAGSFTQRTMAETLQGTTSNFKVLLLVAELSEFLNLIKKN
jgi:hypothetical protein